MQAYNGFKTPQNNDDIKEIKAFSIKMDNKLELFNRSGYSAIRNSHQVDGTICKQLT